MFKLLGRRSSLNLPRWKITSKLFIDIAKHTIQQQDQALVEKEREAVRRIQAAREEEFTKFAKVENDK